MKNKNKYTKIFLVLFTVVLLGACDNNKVRNINDQMDFQNDSTSSGRFRIETVLKGLRNAGWDNPTAMTYSVSGDIGDCTLSSYDKTGQSVATQAISGTTYLTGDGNFLAIDCGNSANHGEKYDFTADVQFNAGGIKYNGATTGEVTASSEASVPWENLTSSKSTCLMSGDCVDNITLSGFDFSSVNTSASDVANRLNLNKGDGVESVVANGNSIVFTCKSGYGASPSASLSSPGLITDNEVKFNNKTLMPDLYYNIQLDYSAGEWSFMLEFGTRTSNAYDPGESVKVWGANCFKVS